ncbi:MAG: VCBS repeat-containing protein, partial [Gemmatimonadetes bacterium]|nr:VCBS repeat-containing protein [Gemmatimonadota bacterium]
MRTKWRRLPRRKRLAAVTAGFALLFAAAAAVFVFAAVRDGEPYRPGEAVEGLTAELARDLPADHPRVAFTDVTEDAGIRFLHFSGRRSSQLPEDMGSGAAWGDYDGDGWLDLYVVNMVGALGLSPEQVAASPARAALYHNERNGTFREVAEEAGVALRGWGMGAAWGDYDGDGRIDLLVSAYGTNVLYRNRGDGAFRDATREAGLAAPSGFWTGASWADYDRDGDLDLYITGYVTYDPAASAGSSRQYDVDVPANLNPSAFEPERNLLYRNQGDGTFAEVAQAAGVAGAEGRSLSAAWADLDEDGWPDLYVANDVSDNVLYHNRRDGTFSDVSHGALVADYRGAMGLALGDWNGDGDTDIFITHWIAQENALYDSKLRRQFVSLETPASHPLQFMDEADRWGLGQIALDFIGWGTSFLDYDNDGRPDLLVVNGSTFQRPDTPQLLVPMRDQLFWNRGPKEGFYDVSPAAGPYFREERVGRGAAVADYDNDGDMDAFIVNHGGRPVLLRNDGGNRNHWLELSLEGTRSNRQAIGARVRAVAAGAVQVYEVGAQSSYLSQNS